MLENIVLGMLLKEPLSGYEIKKAIENGVGIFYKASYGSLYPLLTDLTKKGQLIMFEQPQGNRQKNYYKITDLGENAFFDWLKAPVSIKENKDSHLAKIYFFDKLPEEIRDMQLLNYENNNLTYLNELLELEQKFSKLEDKSCCYYKLATLYYGICSIQQNIKWCRYIREQKPLNLLIMKEE